MSVTSDNILLLQQSADTEGKVYNSYDKWKILCTEVPYTPMGDVKDLPTNDWADEDGNALWTVEVDEGFNDTSFQDIDKANYNLGYKIFQHGKGLIKIYNSMNPNDNDFNQLIQVAESFAEKGETVTLTPKISWKRPFIYDQVYGSPSGTTIHRQMPRSVNQREMVRVRKLYNNQYEECVEEYAESRVQTGQPPDYQQTW